MVEHTQHGFRFIGHYVNASGQKRLTESAIVVGCLSIKLAWRRFEESQTEFIRKSLETQSLGWGSWQITDKIIKAI